MVTEVLGYRGGVVRGWGVVGSGGGGGGVGVGGLRWVMPPPLYHAMCNEHQLLDQPTPTPQTLILDPLCCACPLYTSPSPRD